MTKKKNIQQFKKHLSVKTTELKKKKHSNKEVGRNQHLLWQVSSLDIFHKYLDGPPVFSLSVLVTIKINENKSLIETILIVVCCQLVNHPVI